MNKVKKILFSFLLICSLIFVSCGVTACNNKNLIPSFPIESTDPEDQTNKDLILSSTIDGVTYDLLSVTAFSNSKYYEIVSGSYYTGIDLVYCFDVTVELSVNNTSSQDIKLAKGAGDSFISYNEEMKFYYDSSEKTIEVTNQLNGDLFDGTITIASKTNKVITMSFDIFLQGPLYYDLNNYTSAEAVHDFVRSKSKNYYGQYFEQKSQLLQNTIFSYRRGETDVLRFKISANNIIETDFS